MVSEVYDVIGKPLIFVHAGILYKPWYNEAMIYFKNKTTQKTHHKLRYNQRWDIYHISYHQKQILSLLISSWFISTLVNPYGWSPQMDLDHLKEARIAHVEFSLWQKWQNPHPYDIYLYIHIYIYIWLVVSNMNFIFHFIYGIILPID